VAHACCEFMASHLHPSNCVGVRNFAELHGHNELVTRADQFILHNFTLVAASEEFHEMTANNLEAIIASSYLNVRSEVRVIHSVVVIFAGSINCFPLSLDNALLQYIPSFVLALVRLHSVTTVVCNCR